MNVRTRTWMWLLLVATLAWGCKDEDREHPNVAISSPDDGFAIMADSEFVVAGIATDDRAVTSVTAVLFAAVTEQVVMTQTVSMGAGATDFSFPMPAGDRYTPSGEYTLRVGASDAAGNVGYAFAQITIHALPLAYRGLAWACDLGNGLYSLHHEDSLGVVTTAPQGLSNLVAMRCDNRNGQLVSLESTPGSLIAWDFHGLDKLYQVDQNQGTGTATYSGLGMNATRYFCSFSVPSYLRSYRADGAPMDEFEDALHPGTAIVAADEHVYMGLKGLVGSPLKVDKYTSTTGNLVATYLTGWEVEELVLVSENLLLACGNAAGMGRIAMLDPQTLVLDEEVELTEQLLGVTSANGRVWLIANSGLYEFFPASATLSNLLAVGDYSSIALDATRNQVLLGGDGVLEVRTGAGSLVRSLPGITGKVAFIDLHYNK